MKVEAYFLLFLAAFGAIVGLIFWATGLSPDYVTTTGGGTVMLAAFGLLGLLPGAYYLWWSKRMTPRAEDDPYATQSAGAGDIGTFPSSSIWPFTLGMAAFLIAIALVFGLWSAILGGALAVSAVIGVIAESRHGGVV